MKKEFNQQLFETTFNKHKALFRKAVLNEVIADPTKNQMMNYLAMMYGQEEGFKDDAEKAIYWFASAYHGGQESNLYSALSSSPFRPASGSHGPEDDGLENMMYKELVDKFGDGDSGDVDESLLDRDNQSGKVQSTSKVTNKDKSKISTEFKKFGVDGNGRFDSVSKGILAVSNALDNTGFTLDMVTGDILLGDKGSRLLPYRRKQEQVAGATEQPSIENSRIVFNWEKLGDKYEIQCYAS